MMDGDALDRLVNSASDRLARRKAPEKAAEPDPTEPPEFFIGARGGNVVLQLRPPPRRGQDTFPMSPEVADKIAAAFQQQAAKARANRTEQMKALKGAVARA